MGVNTSLRVLLLGVERWRSTLHERSSLKSCYVTGIWIFTRSASTEVVCFAFHDDLLFFSVKTPEKLCGHRHCGGNHSFFFTAEKRFPSVRNSAKNHATFLGPLLTPFSALKEYMGTGDGITTAQVAVFFMLRIKAVYREPRGSCRRTELGWLPPVKDGLCTTNQILGRVTPCCL